MSELTHLSPVTAIDSFRTHSQLMKVRHLTCTSLPILLASPHIFGQIVMSQQSKDLATNMT